jgi:CRISPR/Cas system-associated protein Csm6
MPDRPEQGFAAVTETTLPPVTLDPDRAYRLRRITERRAKLDAQWRDEIRAAVLEDHASLRDVAEAAGISHTAVKFIAHGRK